MNETYFIVASVFTLLCALGVVLSRNPVYSAFSLVLSFFGLAGLFGLWGSPFLAAIQVLVYAGAIVVLFVFVVMLLDFGKSGNPAWQSALTSILALALSAGLGWMVYQALVGIVLPEAGVYAPIDVRVVCKELFTKYLWPFEVLSLFMLSLIVAIYALARPDSAEGRE